MEYSAIEDLAATILESALFVLSDEDNWTQGADTRNAYNELVPEYSPAACKFCISGAISAAALATNSGYRAPARSLAEEWVVRAIGSVTGVESFIQNFNDRASTTHKDVVEVLERAIAHA